jgi:hypothetical protein
MMNAHSQGVVMTNMRDQGAQHQYLAAAFVAVCPSNDHRKLLCWPEQELLSCEGFPP